MEKLRTESSEIRHAAASACVFRQTVLLTEGAAVLCFHAPLQTRQYDNYDLMKAAGLARETPG